MAEKESNRERLNHFCRDIVQLPLEKTPCIYMGIDPGSEGAIGLICGSVYTVLDIPTYKVKRNKGFKTVFNHEEIVLLFRPLNHVREQMRVVIEVPPPTMGGGRGKASAYAQFRLGIAYGMWPLFLTVKGFDFNEVSPSVWKRDMTLTQDKERSRMVGIEYFPYAPLSRKKDHNRAEGLLLALWLKEKLEGEVIH